MNILKLLKQWVVDFKERRRTNELIDMLIKIRDDLDQSERIMMLVAFPMKDINEYLAERAMAQFLKDEIDMELDELK